MYHLAVATVIFPLFGAIISGLFGKYIGRRGAHIVTISGIFISFLLSLIILKFFVIDNSDGIDATAYTWATIGKFKFEVGFLIDSLTAIMITIVTFVSLMVHIYSIGYMVDDDGYQRFFSYISLFTFAMLMLVMANNFMQLFFGWEGVGLVSYLLIGFWFKKDSAVFANLKAFLVNRVGDFGFLLGIAFILLTFGSLHYSDIFSQVPNIPVQKREYIMTIICIFLFIGAMGKSAQIPLHVWLPDSMEGPTPISALIHAATMVTAGIFMVSRMSPLFEYSETARSFVLIIGSTGALFMGILGIVQNDIKRVIAYSTLSQLGYMTAALGASAYQAAIFHLATHAFFKALLFLGAGSVIIGMHHEQNIWKMGGIKKYMPITYWTFLIGSLALAGFPFFSGFYSKDIIIEAVGESSIFGSHYAYFCVLAGVLATAIYTFRVFFVVFHGEERMSKEEKSHLHESPFVVWLPLVLLAIPSAFLGILGVKYLVFSGVNNYFHNSILVLSQNNVLAIVGSNFKGVFNMAFESFLSLPFLLILLGIGSTWYLYIKQPELPEKISDKFSFIYKILINNYYFDKFNQIVFVKSAQKIGNVLWKIGDVNIIDGLLVNGSAKSIRAFANYLSGKQLGFVYFYVMSMLIGMLVFFVWLVK